MKNKYCLSFLATLMVLTAGLADCGSGGRNDSSQDDAENGTDISLSGTAAAGAPIASVSIMLKDKNGSLKTGVTGTDGKYSFDVNGMTAPFLIKVPFGATYLYSVATSSGTANVHPFTDLIVRDWYESTGGDADTAFGSAADLPTPPTAADISTIEAVVRSILKTWLQQEGLDASTFNLITSSFDANSSGFDHILDNTKVTIDSGQVTVKSSDPTTGIGSTAVSTGIVNLTSADTASPSIPAVPVAAAADKNKVVLVWNASTDDVGVAGYNIYRDGRKIGESPYTTYADSSGLQPLTTYCYQIESFDGEGNVSANRSGQACTTTLGNSDTALPSTPSYLTATPLSTSQVSLSWTASTDVDNNLIGYKVYRDGQKTESVAVPATNYVDKGLSGQTQYCYTVKAFDSAGNISPDSSTVCATTL